MGRKWGTGEECIKDTRKARKIKDEIPKNSKIKQKKSEVSAHRGKGYEKSPEKRKKRGSARIVSDNDGRKKGGKKKPAGFMSPLLDMRMTGPSVLKANAMKKRSGQLSP